MGASLYPLSINTHKLGCQRTPFKRGVVLTFQKLIREKGALLASAERKKEIPKYDNIFSNMIILKLINEHIDKVKVLS